MDLAIFFIKGLAPVSMDSTTKLYFQPQFVSKYYFLHSINYHFFI